MASAATAAGTGRRAASARRARELAAALDRALAAAAADERIGPLLRATRLRLRLRCTDAKLTVDIEADTERNLSWSFDPDPDWEPRLELAMECAVANRWLQGRESLPIAIARGQVKVRGDAKVALLYLPATRMLCEPYRRAVEADFPTLAA